jgi:hypothetical protein
MTQLPINYAEQLSILFHLIAAMLLGALIVTSLPKVQEILAKKGWGDLVDLGDYLCLTKITK